MSTETKQFTELTPEVIEQVHADLDEFVVKVKAALIAGNLRACACGAIIEYPEEHYEDGTPKAKSIGVMHGYTDDIFDVLHDGAESLRESAQLNEQGGMPQ